MMKRTITLFLLFITVTLQPAIGSVATPTPLIPQPEHGLSAVMITKFIDRYHYKKTKLNDHQSELILNQYLKSLDPSRSFFTQQDINDFDQYKTQLDEALAKGDLTPAFLIFRQFNQRRIERADYAISLLDKPFDFTREESYSFDRSESPWAAGQAELNEIWRQRVKNDMLMLSLAKKEEKDLKKTLLKRYELIKTRTTQFKAEDTYEIFINSYLRTIEPHTNYFSPRSSENFKINMRLSLEGIGAVLQTVDDHTVVQRIITGGPADLAAQLYAEDRIIGVAQGEEGEVVDVVGWRIGDVVELIRGAKGTLVRLQILPKSSGVDGPSKIIKIVRNKVDLDKQQVQKSIIELPDGKSTKRVGVITIPTFYMDFDGAARGDDDYRSTTRDTRVLIEELKKEQVEGIVIDLRGDGGGSLTEAISLTGLFIESGPVVMVKENSGQIKSHEDTDEDIAYRGPLAVLVDRYSASASEIFAGAIQDYGRGIVLGEATFGKGTVQTVLDLNRYSRKPGITLGQVKLTMAQFFRVNGDSTQHRGVVPDIEFPGAEKSADEGERAFENALPWAQVKAANYQPYAQFSFDLSDVRARHQQRIKDDIGFQFLQSQNSERHSMMEKKSVSLLKKQRKLEREKQEAERTKQLDRFRLSLGMPSQEDADALVDKEKKQDIETLTEEVEKIELREASAILLDVIETAGGDKLTVQVNQNKGMLGGMFNW